MSVLLFELQLIIRRIENKKKYDILYDFVEKNIDRITAIEDETELRKIIKIIMYYTNGSNYYWLKNEKIKDNPIIISEIMQYIMDNDLYKISSLSYTDILENIDFKFFSKEFCHCFLEKNLNPIDTLEILSIMHKLDKNSYKILKEKYKKQTYNQIEIEFQVNVIIEQGNYEFIEENIDFILDNYSTNKIIDLYKDLRNNKICRSKIQEYILNRLDEVINLDIDIAVEFLYYSDENEKIFKSIIEYLKENIDIIINRYNDSKDLFEIKSIYDSYKDLVEPIKNYFNSHKDELIERLYNHVTYLFICYEDNQSEFKEERRTVKEILKLIIDELCQKENVSFGDIEKLGEGVYSKVYRIGDKVIKLGINRSTKKIPINPYIVQPLLRKDFSVDGKEYGEQLIIEVTERVQKLPTILTQQEIEKILYELYKKQRDIGIEWVDIKIDNVGILLKDNIIHWPSPLKPTPEQLGQIDDESIIKLAPLKAGEFVLLDADLIFTEEDFKKRFPKIDEDIKRGNFNPYWEKFHNRYENEKKKSKNK